MGGTIRIEDRTFCIVAETGASPRAAVDPRRSEIARFRVHGETFLVIEGPPHKATPPHADDAEERLTGREMQVVVLVARGLGDKRVAEALGIEVHTVRTHLRRIYCKLRVHTKAAMVYRCTGLLRAARLAEDASWAGQRLGPRHSDNA